MAIPNGAVVVGVDGSTAALRAVRLAAAEALARGQRLHVLHAFIWPMLRVSEKPPPGGPPGSGLRNQAERIVADAVAEATTAGGTDLPVTGEVVDGQPAAVLIGSTSEASLTVLGSRGLGGFTGLLVGSVATQVSAYAAGPVLVDRGEHHRGPVVLGVSGSPESDPATEFAVQEAARRRTWLAAVHAFRHPVAAGPGDMLPLVFDAGELRTDEERLIAESLAGWADRYPEVPIKRRLVRGRTAHALIEESTRAQLVVVGSPARHGLAGLRFGSVSQALLHHSGCPIVVVPEVQPGPEPRGAVYAESDPDIDPQS